MSLSRCIPAHGRFTLQPSGAIFEQLLDETGGKRGWRLPRPRGVSGLTAGPLKNLPQLNAQALCSSW